MLQSEQLDTVLVLAADDKVAAGLLIQRMPLKGEGNLGGRALATVKTKTRSAATRTTTALPTWPSSLTQRRAARTRCGHHPAPSVLGGKTAAFRAFGGGCRAHVLPARCSHVSVSAACCRTWARPKPKASWPSKATLKWVANTAVSNTALTLSRCCQPVHGSARGAAVGLSGLSHAALTTDTEVQHDLCEAGAVRPAATAQGPPSHAGGVPRPEWCSHSGCRRQARRAPGGYPYFCVYCTYTSRLA
jgi:hypothetical protein